jgi:hypothetical protein
MAESGAEMVKNMENEKRLATDIEREVLRAIARIEYGSIELVIHDGKVVQIECREKIRLGRGEADGNNAVRALR